MQFIVMYGDHGGELDREPCTEHNVKDAFTKLIERVEINEGDNFVIIGTTIKG